MKVAIVEDKGFDNYQELKKILDSLKITSLISGQSSLTEQYANDNKLSNELANDDITKNADLIICFWNGNQEIQSLIDKADDAGKNILVIKT